MKPLLQTVVAISLLLAVKAHPENIEQVKELPQTKEPIVEADESNPQTRIERCTTCTSLNFKSPKDVLAAIQAQPGAEVHTQQSFEGCSTDNGCAGVKVKDGQVVQRYGNVNAFKAAEAANTGNEFNFLTAAALAANPFWWMNQDGPFKSGNFEKFSKSSSSFSSSGSGGAALNLAANPFLNGDFSNNFAGKPNYQSSSSSFESSYSSKGDLDLTKNPFLNGGFKAGAFGAQNAGFGADLAQTNFAAGSSNFGSSSFGAQGNYGASSLGSNYVPTGRPIGSAGSNVNLVQTAQKASEFDFAQQTQQNIDEVFQGSGNVETSVGDLQQTCAGQGYVCVPKAQCNNGVVNSNGANILQANSKKQYCSISTEICCRLGVASVNNFGQTNLFQTNKGFGNVPAVAPSPNLIETDSFSAGSENNGIFRPGVVGLKPGIPYLPPIDSTNQPSNIIPSTFPPPIITTPRPLPPRPLPPRPITPIIPVTSTAAPGYLPPIGEQSINRETFVPNPNYNEGFINLDQERFPGKVTSPVPLPSNDVPAGCAAALKCTPIEFCTAEGVISNTSVILTRDQDAYRVPLTDCKDLETGRIGKCCRDPYYTDPWPTNQLGKWVNGVFGGNDGKYVPDSRGSANNVRPVTPPTTGSVIYPNFRTTQKPTVPSGFGTTPVSRFPTTVTPFVPGPTPGVGQFSKGGQNQFTKNVQGQFTKGGQGQYGLGGRGQVGLVSQGQFSQVGKGQVGLASQGQFGRGQVALVGQGDTTQLGAGQYGQGQYGQVGRGQIGVNGQGIQLGVGQIGQGQYSQVERGQTGVGSQGQFSQVGREQVGVVGQGDATLLGVGQIGATGQYGQVGRGQIGISSQGVNTQLGVGQLGGQGQFSQVGRGQVGVGQAVGVGQTGLGQFSQTGRGQVGVVGQGQSALGVGQNIGRGQIGTGQTNLIGLGQAGVSQTGQRGQVGLGQVGVTGQGQYSQVGRGQAGVVGQGIGQAAFGAGVAGQSTQLGVGQIGVVDQGEYTQLGNSQIGVGGQGQFTQVGRGQIGVGGAGQFGAGSQVTNAFSRGQEIGSQAIGGQGQFGIQQGIGSQAQTGQGVLVSQGQEGQYSIGSQGQYELGGIGQYETQRQGQQGFGIINQASGLSKASGQLVTQNQGQQVSQGSGQIVSQGKGQFVSNGQKTIVSQGGGAFIEQGKGQTVSQGFGSGISQGSGQIVSQGKGQFVSNGQKTIVGQGGGAFIEQGKGQTVSQGFGSGINQGSGQIVSQGKGQFVSNGQNTIVSQGGGAYVEQGKGQTVSQGFGSGIRQGGGFSVSQGSGIGVENEYGESVQRVFLQRYKGDGKCGLLNPQKPYGNKADLEVDFAEIPWQAMVLLQTNKSLLCGGVITRPDVVVTSAACVEGLAAKNVLIKGGEWKLGIDDEPLPFQIVQVKHILRHPLYKSGSLLYDAAVLVLAENLRLSNNIYPICLPSSSDSIEPFYNGVGECIVTGWGKIVLQAHLEGAIMHSLNVSLINPGECKAKLSSDYPHLLEQYNEDSCVCGQPTNPLNNICKVDIGSALACTTGNGRYVMQGVYSWDSGCQVGNQIASFYKFDLEWYEWSIGLIESVRFAQFTTVTTGKITGFKTGVKTTQFGGANGQFGGATGQFGGSTSQFGGANGQFGGANGQFGGANGQFGSQFGTGSQFKGGASGIGFSGVKGFAVSSKGQVGFEGASQANQASLDQFNGKFGTNFDSGFNTQIKAPISNTYSATYSEKKVFQTEPKIITYTTKPEIVTYTTKPEIFTYTTKPEIFTYTTKPKIITYTTKPKIITYTTKPKIITYTTKPQIITYETSGSGTNPQYVAPGVTFNPQFSDLVGHKHDSQCQCIKK